MPLARVSKLSKCERQKESTQQEQKYMKEKETLSKKVHETVRNPNIAENTKYKQKGFESVIINRMKMYKSVQYRLSQEK